MCGRRGLTVIMKSCVRLFFICARTHCKNCWANKENRQKEPKKVITLRNRYRSPTENAYGDAIFFLVPPPDHEHHIWNKRKQNCHKCGLCHWKLNQWSLFFSNSLHFFHDSRFGLATSVLYCCVTTATVVAIDDGHMQLGEYFGTRDHYRRS